MSIEKKDLFQRIADAVNSADALSLSETDYSNELKPDDIVIGELPLHLRHICLLIDEITNEIKSCKSERDFFDLFKSASLLKVVFQISLRTHLPELCNYFGFKICSGWKVVGLSEDETKLMFADAMGLDSSEFTDDLDDVEKTHLGQKLH